MAKRVQVTGKTTIALAEALGRRKELQGLVEELRGIDAKKLYEVHAQRKPAAEGIDDVIVSIPLLSASQVMREIRWHSRQLREIDSVIQQTNWATEVEVNAENMSDYIEDEKLKR